MKKLILTIVFLTIATGSTARPRDARGPVPGSILADSLAFPGEVFVIGLERLKTQRINTLDDILQLLPGVSWWRVGPAGAYTGMSVEGRPSGHPSLLVNGRPFTDPWSGEALGRLVPLSRLIQVEVVYSASPAVTGLPGTGSVINLVLEEGGRKGPIAVADFSNGKGNRRARRFWFSTPESFINLTVAYDEYLEDASFPSIAHPEARIGQYDSRSILSELKLTTDGGDELLLHLQRYEDTFGGSETAPWSPPAGDETRYSGVDSRLEYRKGRLRLEVGQRLVERNGPDASVSGMVAGAAARWNGGLQGIAFSPYIRAERGSFENRITGIYSPSDYEDIRLGSAVRGNAPGGLTWRAGVHGGYHSEAEGWVGGEAGISHGDPGGYYQNLLVSRNLVIPPAGRYFNPAPYEGGPVSASAGDPGLEPGISDEVSFRIGFAGKVSLEAFARRESSIVHVSDEDPALLVQDGTSDVTGTRGRFRWDSRMFGMDYGCILTAEYYADRNDHTFGIAEYSILGSAYISRRSFKETETVMLRFDGVSSGERSWGDLTLDPFWTADLTFSITVMSAVIQLQYKNVFDSEYEVYPGYLQHGRHLRYGVIWNIID